MAKTPKGKTTRNSTATKSAKNKGQSKRVGDPFPVNDCTITGDQLLSLAWETLFAASGMETGEEGMVIINSTGFRVVPAPSDTRTLRSGPPNGVDFKAG